MFKVLQEFRNDTHLCKALQLKRLCAYVCVCVQAGNCACVCVSLLPTHGNVAQGIGEYLWGHAACSNKQQQLPQATGDAELADEIVVEVE